MNNPRNIVFIAWDGSGPHYMQGLFIPIFSGLRERGFEVKIIHLSSMNNQDIESTKELCSTRGVVYNHIEIKRSLLGFFKSVFQGVLLLNRLTSDMKECTILPRSIMPAMLCFLSRKRKGVELVYDADGLAIDERVDFAGWKTSSLRYKLFRFIEKWAILNSSRILVRTEKARNIIQNRYRKNGGDDPSIHVVYNGRDQSIFSRSKASELDSLRRNLGIEHNDRVVVYCGTLAPQYSLIEMLSWFETFKEVLPNSKFLIVSREVELLQKTLLKFEFANSVISTSADIEDIPRLLSLAHVGLSFRQPTFSMKGVAPIKIGEYLLCGLPVVSSKGIGDTEEQLEESKYSLLVDLSKMDDIRKSAILMVELLETTDRNLIVDDSVRLGSKYYGLGRSVESYLEALN